jgi:hypothetical protein
MLSEEKKTTLTGYFFGPLERTCKQSSCVWDILDTEVDFGKWNTHRSSVSKFEDIDTKPMFFCI